MASVERLALMSRMIGKLNGNEDDDEVLLLISAFTEAEGT